MAEFRGRIYDDITQTMGATPLVRLNRLPGDTGCRAEVLAKLEFFNPLGSVKDRIGVSMIEAAEREGRIRPGTVIVEATSGNTGIGLAFACAAKGYRLIVTMPESMSIERRKILALLGAEIELTPAADRMLGSIARAEELIAELPDAYMPQQFENPANPQIHVETTAEEIWNDTGGKFDALVLGTGTGGTITGVASALKPRNAALKVFACEPENSAVISGGEAGPHAIQGMGPGFIPKILDTSLIDEVLKITDAESYDMARRLAAREGIPGGISSGAAVAGALRVGARPEWAGKTIVTLTPSCAERYLSTPLFDGLG